MSQRMSSDSRTFREMLLSASIASTFLNDLSNPLGNPKDFFILQKPETERAITPNGRNSPGAEKAKPTSVCKEAVCTSIKESGLHRSCTDDSLSREDHGGPPVEQNERQIMDWWQTGVLMIAETICIGALSLPHALSVLGLIPGLILLIFFGLSASYTGYIIGQMKLAFPTIHSMADAGRQLFGRSGSIIVGAGQILFLVFIMASHVLVFSKMMNAITSHAACTVTYMAMGTIISLLLTLPRAMKKLTYLSIISFISIIATVVVTIVSVSIERPALYQDVTSGRMLQDVRLWPEPDTEFHTAFLAVANIVFAYAGHIAFFTLITDMKKPEDFPKALILLQVADVSIYTVTAVVIYYCAGNHIASPAVDSATPLFRKIAYGVATPTILIAGVITAHIAAQQIYFSFRGSRKADRHEVVPTSVRGAVDSSNIGVAYENSYRARGLWVGLCTALWILAWIITETIPVFSDLLGLASALFASWIAYGLPGMFWMYMNVELQRACLWPGIELTHQHGWSWNKRTAFAVNILNISLALIVCVLGVYASAKSISINSYTNRPFSCVDNSGFITPKSTQG